MTDFAKTEIVVIGGSAGSLPVVMQIVQSLPADFVLPVIIVIHRQKNVLSEFTKILAYANRSKKITEPDDKDLIEKSVIYIAPQNYHLLIEKDHTFSLDYSEAVKYSRPSIDVTLESAAGIYKEKLAAILLSGANNDGTAGLQSVVKNGGMAIVQNPASAEFTAMPRSAVAAVPGIQVLEPAAIADFINNVNFNLK